MAFFALGRPWAVAGLDGRLTSSGNVRSKKTPGRTRIRPGALQEPMARLVARYPAREPLSTMLRQAQLKVQSHIAKKVPVLRSRTQV